MKKIDETLTILIEQYSIREKRLQLNLLASLFFFKKPNQRVEGGSLVRKKSQKLQSWGRDAYLAMDSTVSYNSNSRLEILNFRSNCADASRPLK